MRVISRSHAATKDTKVWTILDLVNWSSECLSGHSIDSPRLTAELLLSHVLQCSRIDLYAHFDKPLKDAELARFKSCMQRRISHEPLQYIIGQTEFMGIKLRVDRRALIPRPETEVLVEHVLNLCSKEKMSAPKILDIGTGSGNIAVSLAIRMPQADVDAIDCDELSLSLARENVHRHGLNDRVHLLCADILKASDTLEYREYGYVVSNPPYISRDEFESLQPEVRDFEPSIALTDKGDGLTFFRTIAEKGKTLLHPGGYVVAEMSYSQCNPIENMFTDAGYSDVSVVRDYDGNSRVIHAQWK